MKKFVLATVFALASTGVLAKDLSVIRFGVDPTFAPFESKNPDGQLVGFDIDLGNAICAELKVKCVWVENAFDSIIPALRAKKFDAVLSAMTINDQRKKNVDFSDRLYNSPNRLIAKKGQRSAAYARIPERQARRRSPRHYPRDVRQKNLGA